MPFRVGRGGCTAAVRWSPTCDTTYTVSVIEVTVASALVCWWTPPGGRRVTGDAHTPHQIWAILVPNESEE